MGSGSSNQAPKETQSAPATARATPNKPKRNRQFEEVQIAGGQGGSTPRSRQPARSQGASPRPNQATSSSTKNTRGTDPGASGSTSDRSKQQASQRQGGAANGRKEADHDARTDEKVEGIQQQAQTKNSNMPSQQHVKVRKSNHAGKEIPMAASLQELMDGVKRSDVSNRMQSIRMEEVKASGQTEENDPVKDAVYPSGSLEPSSRNQVTDSHGNRFQANRVKARESARVKFHTDISDQKQKNTVIAGDSLTDPKRGHVDSRKVPDKTVATSMRKLGNNEDALVKTKSEDKGVSRESETTVKKNPESSSLIPQNSRKKEMSSVPDHASMMNGAAEDIGVLENDNISFDQGSDPDVDIDSRHGIEDKKHDDLYDDEVEAAVTAGLQNHNEEQQQPEANDDRAETISMKDEDIVFETFYHRSGKEFQCIYQSGMRFYLDDWGSKEWQPFPKRWYNEGLLVTNTILKDENAEQGRNEQGAGASGQGQSSRSQGRGQGQGQGGGGGDDREGFLMHPTKGRVPTYIFYKKHNVHMYFDRDTGSWVRMPIGWELHHDMVRSLVDQVDEAVPTWGDRHDILALLRACNYDPDECISIYLHLERDEWMKGPKTSKENKILMEKEARILELEKRVKHLESQLQKEIVGREDAERNLEEQMNKFSELEADQKETEAHLSAVTGGRPPTARPFSRMVKPGQKGAKGAVVGAAAKGGKQVQSGEVVNPDDVLDLNANAKELRKAHTRVKMDVERFMGDMKHVMEKLGPAFKQLKQSEKGTKNEIEEVRALYRKEALQRKLLYNQLQELRGNIRVFCRVRKDDRAENCLKYPSDQDLIATNQAQKKMFSFDKVFDPSSTQEAVFEDTKPIITSCADGYNVCLLAYGQTGSGKTFTMMGPDSNPGINIRAMKELFQVCSERKETMSYKLSVSLVEIYNETIQDLLTSDAKTLELRTAGNKVDIPGLIEYEIKNLDDVKKVMAMGDKNRSVASTKMNSTSSRSHLVLMLVVEGHDKVTSAISRGTLVLCDLAGSERISKTEAEGQRLVEAAAINKSLSALGQVFSALRSSQLHVPYRNSKLTQILQPSLGGDAKACLFVNVSPDAYNFAETVSTLTFGSNARQVALGQAKQNISKGKG